MIKVENIEVYNIARAIYSARNALNSWDKSDSDLKNDILGENDLKLAQKLYNASAGGNYAHRKFLRQIFVTMDITAAPQYWVAELDTYKIGTTRNSCSLQHKGAERDFTLDDFTYDKDDALVEKCMQEAIDNINLYRRQFKSTGDYKYFRIMRQMLPQGYNYRFTLTLSYENVINMITQRKNHKLSEWREFVRILKKLPYIKEIMGDNDEPET